VRNHLPSQATLASRRRQYGIGLALFLAFILVLATLPVRGQTELELVDGRVLTGTSVRKEGSEYILKLESGSEIAFPVELVRAVRLVVQGSPYTESDTPQQLAGEPVHAPRQAEQLKVFGEPSKFAADIIDNSWTPSTDWDMDPTKQNNFAPSTWAEDIVDSSWEPRSDWNAGDDVLKSGRSTWQKGSIDSSWTPTSGFK
jgi:hypothetical protein